MLTDKLFTGQREMEGLGIYHYQARFYSPTLGRFLSPDTIIPGTSSQSLNRYSYVLNNPINANDPSGHKCNGAPEECLDNSNKPINGADWGYSGDLSTSSDPSQPSTIDSEDAAVLSLYNVYLTLWGNKDGWWWDQYGSGGFTIWEFMAVMWAYEQHGFPNTQIMQPRSAITLLGCVAYRDIVVIYTPLREP